MAVKHFTIAQYIQIMNRDMNVNEIATGKFTA